MLNQQFLETLLWPIVCVSLCLMYYSCSRHADSTELPQIPPAEVTEIQRAESTSFRSSSMPIPVNSHLHGSSTPPTSANIYTHSLRQEDGAQEERLYNEISTEPPRIYNNIVAEQWVEQVDVTQRDARETVESALYRSSEELRADMTNSNFNIYDSPS